MNDLSEHVATPFVRSMRTDEFREFVYQVGGLSAAAATVGPSVCKYYEGLEPIPQEVAHRIRTLYAKRSASDRSPKPNPEWDVEPVEVAYSDADNAPRRFRMAPGFGGTRLEATEIRTDGTEGLKFSVRSRRGRPFPYDELDRKIFARLQKKDLSRDFDGKLVIPRPHLYVRGQLVTRPSDVPVVLIDGMEFTWREFGDLLAPFARNQNQPGSGFRLQLTEVTQSGDE